MTGTDPGPGGPPDRPRTVDDLVAAWAAFAGLIEPLGDAAWRRPTRCTGWEVRHVAGHVVGMTVDAAAGRPTTDPDAQAATFGRLDPPRAARTLSEAAAPLATVLAGVTAEQWAAPLGDRFPTLGEAVLTLLHDLHVHGDDIAVALGRDAWDGPGRWASVTTAVLRLRRRGWSGPAVVVDGREVLPGDAPAVRTTAHAFVLAATGRLDPVTLGLDRRVDIYAPG
ncbi:MAG TPA: maleylpyruvate isomerase family mycothiol-dependent enzyme [Acidimicrobiales bacterium]